LTIHPVLRATPYIPLPCSLPLAPGTPITLLPHSTPAYYLANYTGPTSALVAQFDQSLAGMGAGEWQTYSHPSGQRPTDYVDRKDPIFVVAWINVENKQGEDKGVTVIWPMRLCLSFVPGHPKLKNLLDYVPELPSQLQSSLLTSIPVRSPFNSQDRGSTPLSGRRLFPRSLGRRAHSGPPSETLRTFRMLSPGKGKDMNGVAMEVGGYVDAVAREREKERERMKKERELANSPNLAAKTPGRNPSDSQAPGPSTIPRSPSQPQSVSGPTPAPHPSQHFYPSPPQSNPPQSAPLTGNAPTSPEIQPTPMADSEPPGNEENSVPLDEPPEAAQPSASFDSNVDTYWAQPQNNEDFMDMGMDFNMGFVDNTGGGGGAYGRVTMDFDDAFTEDDFDFFDRPTASASKVVPIPIKMEGLTPAAGPASLGMDMSPPLFSDGLHLSGPGPPNQSPWTMGSLGEGFTPRFTDHHHTGENIPPTPQLLPPSPGPTPPSLSAPTTPNVKLAHRREHTIQARLGTSIFEPIPFDPSHRIADGKYAVGKFALPSPPDEEDRTEPMFFSIKNGWRYNYEAATDHRIGIVRKLIGVKRKSFDQGTRRIKMSPSWIREHEDWEGGMGKMEVDEDLMKDESDDDDADADSPILSRPSTPTPAYVPLGPTLLHMHFHHSQLLPRCSPLRPPGAAVAQTAAPPPTNVPTPVSPAAMIGAASEKSKSLEAAASTVAREVVENVIWAEVWRSNTGGHGGQVDGEVWQSDVKNAAQLLSRVRGLESDVDLSRLFQLGEPATGSVLQELEPPMLSVTKSDAVIQVLPSALRFWEKLGLGPRGGKKDVTAFALFEDIGEERQTQVETWLNSVSAMYTVCSIFLL
jgi:mediator of RNA polymerase II transcription subunit 13, fungi type